MTKNMFIRGIVNLSLFLNVYIILGDYALGTYLYKMVIGEYLFILKLWDYGHFYPLYSMFQVSSSVYSYELVNFHHNLMFILLLILIIVWWSTINILREFTMKRNIPVLNGIPLDINAYIGVLFEVFDWLVNRWVSVYNVRWGLELVKVDFSFFSNWKYSKERKQLLKDNFPTISSYIPRLLIIFFFNICDKFTHILMWIIGILFRVNRKPGSYVDLKTLEKNNSFTKEGFQQKPYDYDFINYVLYFLSFYDENLRSMDSIKDLETYYTEDVLDDRNTYHLLDKPQLMPFGYKRENNINLIYNGSSERSSVLFSQDKMVKNFFLNHTFNFSLILECVWTLIPTIVISSILLPSGNLLYTLDSNIDPTFTFKIVGHQWYWTYEFDNHIYMRNWNIFQEFYDKDTWSVYELLDRLQEMESLLQSRDYSYITYCYNSNLVDIDSLGIGMRRLLEVDNRLVVPTNTVIRFVVTSSDVIHSFAVPRIGMKIDAVPGRLNKWTGFFTIPGVYYGQCSELCGPAHGYMPIVIHAVPYEFFIDYVKNFKDENSYFTRDLSYLFY